MGPLNLTADWGSTVSYLVPLLIGFGFGAVLEMSGFGDSRKLAAQFYLKDLTVLKVMFTGIIVAAALLFASSAFGLIDFDKIYVNPTYMIPGLVGGLIMGVGFIVGGFCPGTSLVATSTLKIDGMFFAGGVALGIFGFGETVSHFDRFWYSTAGGRLTLAEFFNADAGVVLVAVVAMALVLFLLSQVAEQHFGRGVKAARLRWLPRSRGAWAAMAVLLLISGVTAIKGQPGPEEKWLQIEAEAKPALESREVFVHPLEVAEVSQNAGLYTKILDLRSEANYNLFHLRGARLTTMDELGDVEFVKELKNTPANTVVFTVSNDEREAEEAWRRLKGQNITNLYIVEGGINNWLKIFTPPPCLALPHEGKTKEGQPAFDFFRAVGDCCNSAYPDIKKAEKSLDCYLASHTDSKLRSQADHGAPVEGKRPLERKVKLEVRAVVAGGCG